jgi:hypothetical protein
MQSGRTNTDSVILLINGKKMTTLEGYRDGLAMQDVVAIDGDAFEQLRTEVESRVDRVADTSDQLLLAGVECE